MSGIYPNDKVKLCLHSRWRMYPTRAVSFGLSGTSVCVERGGEEHPTVEREGRGDQDDSGEDGESRGREHR